MRVMLKKVEVIVRIKPEGAYTIDMFGVPFEVSSISNDFYMVSVGKHKGWILYKEHCVNV